MHRLLAMASPISHLSNMIIGPNLLKVSALKRPTRIFLCGPGIGAVNFQIREFAKTSLTNVGAIEVVYGEDIEKISSFKRKKKDLQTLELDFAHSVDYTFLILESPGSIAELGTFSMVENIRGRLVVLVPSQFYRDQSYIARGPLSLISGQFQSNIIYFDRKLDKNLRDRILFPLTFYKYANYRMGWKYVHHINSAYRDRGYKRNSYEDFISPVRDEFADAATYAGILILGNPTFPELVSSTSMSPGQTSEALRRLFQAGKIMKGGGGRYDTLMGFADSILEPFSTTRLSEARAKYVASLDSRMVS